MKAAIYEQQGSAKEVLKISEIEVSSPAQGEVRVKLAYSGLNPSDIKTRTGFNNVPMPFPRVIPNQDGSGIIDQVGPGVPVSRIGERVWIYEAQKGRAFGTSAEYIVLPSKNAISLPEQASLEVGACLGVPALTAHRCLYADGNIKDHWILVQGGAGVVGSAAILLAKLGGAKVITTVSRAEQEEVVRDLGADFIINRKNENVAERVQSITSGKGVARIVEVDLMANLEIDLKCLAVNGTVSAYATENPNASLEIPFLSSMLKGYVFRFVFVYAMSDEAHQDAIEEVNKCLSTGRYLPKIAKTFRLESIAEAHEAQEENRFIGKILIALNC